MTNPQQSTDRSSRQEHLRLLYESFNARDIEAVLAALQPGVRWANGLEGGFVHGREAVRAYWTRQFETLRPRLEVLGVEADGAGREIVRARQTVRDLNGALLQEQEVRHRFTFQGGLVSLFEIVDPPNPNRSTVNLSPPEPTALRFLAISGSLRGASSNTAVLRAAIALAPAGVHVALYEGLGELPHFNPDLDTGTPPREVAEFRAQLEAADAVLICSPEYAHGVPGALKNALDWIVSSGELMGKPVALLNASFAATHAQASLAETLSVMMAQVSITRVPLTTNRLGADDIAARPDLADPLRRALSALEGATLARRD